MIIALPDRLACGVVNLIDLFSRDHFESTDQF